LPLLGPLLAKAQLLQIIVIIIIIIGMIFVYYLLHGLAPANLVNQFGSVGVEIRSPSGYVDLGIAAYDPMSGAVAPAVVSDASPICFAVMYGLNGTNETIQPWARAGQINPEIGDFDASCALNILYDDGTNVVATISIGGQLMYFSTPDLTSTNDDNDTYSLAPTYPVIIERSTDLVQWQPVFTNQISTNTVNQFTDWNGPPNHAFYRTCLSTNSP